MVNSYLRGHPIYFDGEIWRYVDTDEPTVEHWKDRPCGHCGLYNTPEGHDGCLGTLPGVMNACCGHGDVGEAYVQFDLKDGEEGFVVVRGEEAISFITITKER